MSFIYSRARRVLVWLGPVRLPESGQQALRLVKDGKLTPETLQPFLPSSMSWIQRLLQSDYWRRTWIIQEIAMASSVQVVFGHEDVAWDGFITLVQSYRSLAPDDDSVLPIIGLDQIRSQRYSYGATWSLKNLVGLFRDNLCSVMHDKIYTFLGMASDYVDGDLVVDYHATITEVYHNTLMFYHRLKTGTVEDRIQMSHLASLLRHVLGRRCVSGRVEATTPFKRLSLKEEWKKFEESVERAFENDRHCSESNNGGQDFLSILFVTVLLLCLPFIAFGVLYSFLWFIAVLQYTGYWLANLLLGINSLQRDIWEDHAHENASYWLADNTRQNVESGFETAKSNVTVSCMIVSRILHLGPQYHDVIASASEARRWTASLNDYFIRDADLRRARALNRHLLSILYNPDYPAQLHISLLPHTHVVHHGQLSVPSLFLGSSESVALGLAPSGAAIGDYICQLWNSNASAILRVEDDSNGGFTHRLIGRAGVVINSEGEGWDVPRDKDAFLRASSAGKLADFQVDILSLTRLSLDSVGFPTIPAGYYG
ncbi:hypothetical protein AUP68_16962 [Ilyonectria robusta]